MPTAVTLDRLSYEIRGAAMTVHRRVGPGCFEAAYVPCFAYELQKRGVDFRREVDIPLRYDAIVVPRAYEADFIVEGCVVVELKMTARPSPVDEAQLRTYLRLTGCPLALLLNFGARLLKDGILRQVKNYPHGTEPGRIPE